jgi:hypothetical protein
MEKPNRPFFMAFFVIGEEPWKNQIGHFYGIFCNRRRNQFAPQYYPILVLEKVVSSVGSFQCWPVIDFFSISGGLVFF